MLFMSEAIAWLAGIWEGEGTATIQRKSESSKPLVTVHIGNSDRSMLEAAREVFPKFSRICAYAPSGNHKEVSRTHYRIYLSGNNAVEFAKIIIPYVRADSRHFRLQSLIDARP